MNRETIFRKTVLITFLVFLVFGTIYLLIWWLGFDKKFYPIEQIGNFKIPFPVSRWYDFGLICLWPIIIVPLAYIGRNKDEMVLATVGMTISFIFIGMPLVLWDKGIIGISGFFIAVIFFFLGWISTEAYFFVIGNEKRYSRKKIILESFITNVFAGLGAGLAFVFNKGLLIGLIFGLALTLALSLMIITYNILFKSIIRAILNPDEIITEDSR